MNDLIHGLADVLNNPLAALNGYIQLLELQIGRQGDPSVGPTLHQVRHCLQAMERIIRDLEAVGGAPAREGSPLDLAGLVREVTQRELPERSVDLSRLPRSLMWRGDRALLGKGVTALCLLAQAVAAQGVLPRITLEEAPGELSIQATLTALSPSLWRADRTFHPFFLNSSLKKPELGLSPAVAAGVARSLGGRALARWDDEGRLHLGLILPR